MKRLRRIFFALTGLLFLLLAVAFAFPRQVLCLESGPVQADAMVLLGGGMGERPERAAELFKQGEAPKIVLSGEGDAQDHRRILEARGVPSAAIILEPDSKNTKQNAQFTVPKLRELGAKRVIIVTSWYHSRRALRCFRHYAPDLQFYSRPAYYAYDRATRPRQVSGYIRAEYVKLAGYWVAYGVCPF